MLRSLEERLGSAALSPNAPQLGLAYGIKNMPCLKQRAVVSEGRSHKGRQVRWLIWTSWVGLWHERMDSSTRFIMMRPLDGNPL